MNWKQLWFNPPTVRQLEYPDHFDPQLMRRLAMAELEMTKLRQELNEVKEKLIRIQYYTTESRPIEGVKND